MTIRFDIIKLLELLGIKKEGREEIFQKLPTAIEEMESMVETSERFTAYELEVKAISKLGMSFSDWLKLQPSEAKGKETGLMCIMPGKPMSLS